MSNPLISLLQVECVRENTFAYRPQSAKSFVDLTSVGTQQIYNKISDHATYVASLWQDHGAGALVANWYVCELGNFDLGMTLSPDNLLRRIPALAALKNVHLVIIPGGEVWESVSNISVDKLQDWAASQNAIILVSPPDAGEIFCQFPCQALGANILHVGSSTTGSNMANQPPIQLFLPVDWNSYVQPSMLSLGIIQAIDWLLNNKVSYLASDIINLFLSAETKDAQGRAGFNGSAALTAIKTKYGAPLPQPLPIPIKPLPVPVATPVAPPVVVTPPAGPAVAGSITSFTANAGWAPVTFQWVATGKTVTLTDAKGVTRDATGISQMVLSTMYSPPNYAVPYCTLTATGSDGTSVQRKIVAHAAF